MSKVYLQCPEHLFKNSDNQPALMPWDAYTFADGVVSVQGVHFDWVDSNKNVIQEPNATNDYVFYNSGDLRGSNYGSMYQSIHNGDANNNSLSNAFYRIYSVYLLRHLIKINFWIINNVYENYNPIIINDYSIYQDIFLDFPAKWNENDTKIPSTFATYNFDNYSADVINLGFNVEENLGVTLAWYKENLYETMQKMQLVKYVLERYNSGSADFNINNYFSNGSPPLESLRVFAMTFIRYYIKNCVAFFSNCINTIPASALIYYEPLFLYNPSLSISCYCSTDWDDNDNRYYITTSITRTEIYAVWIEELRNFHGCELPG